MLVVNAIDVLSALFFRRISVICSVVSVIFRIAFLGIIGEERGVRNEAVATAET